jgi:hypothetical protein
MTLTKDCYKTPPNIKKITELLLTTGPYKIVPMKSAVKKAIRHRKFAARHHDKGFKYLLPWLECMRAENPGLEYRFERYKEDDELPLPLALGKLKHVALVFPHSAQAFPYLFRIIGIDCAHIKPIVHSIKPVRILFHGSVLTLVTGRTPGNKMIILGLSLSPTESLESIEFLLKLLMDPESEGGAGIPLNREDIVVTSDRGPALIAAVRQCLWLCFHMKCGKHLERSLQKHFKPCKHLLKLYWRARGATTSETYQLALLDLQLYDEGDQGKGLMMRVYLEGVSDWQVHLVVMRGGLMMHMFKSNNIVESVCGWAKDARHLAPFYCLQHPNTSHKHTTKTAEHKQNIIFHLKNIS